MGLGPFYVSVHTTNPELRVKMLKNPNAKNIMQELKWLEGLDIPVHLQIVLCPKYNDGDELKRTLNDIKTLNNVLSVAVVPVGITKFREDGVLFPVTKKIALETISLVDAFNSSFDKPIACCSDEFFLIGGKSVPSKDYYGNFSQLEDGVGALRLLLDDFDVQKKRLLAVIKNKSNLPLSVPVSILFATSKLAKSAMDEISSELNKIENFSSEVVAVESKFWGDKISVAGLITSEDLISSINGHFKAQSSPPTIIIPSVMMRQYTHDFLDGNTLEDVKERTGLDFLVIEDCYSTKEIVDYLISFSKESLR